MKNTLAFLISGLLFCGCSPKQATSNYAAIDLVQPGSPSTWSNLVLNVEKRDGRTLAGIAITQTTAGGEVVTITADKGALSESSDSKSVRLTLYRARMQKSNGTQATFEELPVNLTR